MITEATYSENGTEITFKKSLRHQMWYHKLINTLANDDTAEDQGERLQFAIIAAHAQAVNGLDWTPPPIGASDKKVEASYQAFLDAIPDYETFNALYRVVDSLFKPLADVVQRPDDALTDDERADPN